MWSSLALADSESSDEAPRRYECASLRFRAVLCTLRIQMLARRLNDGSMCLHRILSSMLYDRSYSPKARLGSTEAPNPANTRRLRTVERDPIVDCNASKNSRNIMPLSRAAAMVATRVVAVVARLQSWDPEVLGS